MKKILVLTIPRIEPHRPPIGASIVSTVASNSGCDVTQLDLNIKFFHHCKNNGYDYFNFDDIWDRYKMPSGNESKFIDDFISMHISEIDYNSYDIVMVSVFGISNHFFAERLLNHIAPNRKFRILVGGVGAFITLHGRGNELLVEKFKELDLIDDYIKGECEESLQKYLSGESGLGINNYDSVQISDLNTLPLLSYKFLNLDEYDYLGNKKSVYIEGSRGCVRNCTYCDVAAYWPKYRYRSGKHIANEIINHYENHGITDFYFTDSLVNGSLKAFTEMCETLASYNFKEKISWSGQFIFRNAKSVPPSHFELIAKAGGDTFFVGIETGSDNIRKEMGKNFSNDDIEYQLEQFSKNKLKTTFLMFPGYVTETNADHNETLKMFPRWQRFVADGTINALELGSPLVILENTPLHRNIDYYHLEFLDNGTTATNKFWVSGINPSFDFAERVKRQLEYYEEAIKYNWPIWRLTSRVKSLKNSLEAFYEAKKLLT